jgi:hypothetical protein
MSAIGDLLAYKESTNAIGKAIHALLTSGVFWTALGVLVTVAIALATGLFALYRHLDGKIERSFDARLDAKLRTPTFALESLEATERAALARVQAAEEAAKRQAEKLEQERESALQANQQEHAQRLAVRLQEIETLRTRLEEAETERGRLSQELENAISAPQPQYSGNSVSLLNGYILVVRYAGMYGALQAVEQWGHAPHAPNSRPFIRYAWWYQPDGSGTFASPDTERGFGATEEPFTLEEFDVARRPVIRLKSDHWPTLQIGPIHLEWSSARDGLGYVYFGPPGHHSDEYELAVTSEVNIMKVDASRLNFFQRSVPS